MMTPLDLTVRLRHPKHVTHAIGAPTPDFESMQSEREEAAHEIERLRAYGENMRLVCQQLSARIRELDPTAPISEAGTMAAPPA